jgi:hypothetical protein
MEDALATPFDTSVGIVSAGRADEQPFGLDERFHWAYALPYPVGFWKAARRKFERPAGEETGSGSAPKCVAPSRHGE